VLPGDKYSVMLHGFPTRRWVFSVLIQSLLLVPAAVLSWYASEVGVATWVAQGLDDMTSGGAFWTRWYLSTLFGMETRDFFPPPDNTLIIVHHIAVMIATLGALLSPIVGLYVCGTAILEFGSIWYNLKVLDESSALFKWMYWLSISASNLLAVLLGFWLVTMDVPLGLSLTYLAVDIGVCIGRQREVFKDAEVLGFKKKKHH